MPHGVNSACRTRRESHEFRKADGRFKLRDGRCLGFAKGVQNGPPPRTERGKRRAS